MKQWARAARRLLLAVVVVSMPSGPIAPTDARAGTTSVGDGGSALEASVTPGGLAVDADGNLYIADLSNHRIRKVDPGGIIFTVAGNGKAGFGGDGGLATEATLHSPADVALDPMGNIYIADWWNHRIRRVDAATGIITTVAGDGQERFAGDLGSATHASLSRPEGVVLNMTGDLYIADTGSDRIRKVDGSGRIVTIAGNGIGLLLGDNLPAQVASLNEPVQVSFDQEGNYYIADLLHLLVRRVNRSGIISTVAGSGRYEYSGDGGPATQAGLKLPSDVVVAPDGSIFIADSFNHRVRKVDRAGTISTVAGDGAAGFSGDGGPATSARLSVPRALTLDASGNLYVADIGNYRVRRIGVDGIITTIAGNGVQSS